MRLYESKYINLCRAPNCIEGDRRIIIGERIWWDPNYGVFHLICAPNGQVPLGTPFKTKKQSVQVAAPSPNLVNPQLEPPICPSCGKQHNAQCVRCKAVINHTTVKPAVAFDVTAKRHCYNCWMSNAVTQDIQQAVKPVESINKAIETIKEAAKPPKQPEPKKEDKPDRFDLIELD